MARLPEHPTVQALILALVGAVAGLAWNSAREGGIRLDHPVAPAAGGAEASCDAPRGLVRDVDLAEAQALRQGGAAFVDARPAGAYADGHVEGALHLPSRGDDPSARAIIERLRGAPLVIVYDAEGSCAQARHLADRLAGAGLADVRVMVGGFPGWQELSAPAESGSCEACDLAGAGP